MAEAFLCVAHDGILATGVRTRSGSDGIMRHSMLNCDPVAATTPRGLPARGPRFAPGTDTIRNPNASPT